MLLPKRAKIKIGLFWVSCKDNNWAFWPIMRIWVKSKFFRLCLVELCIMCLKPKDI